MDDVEDAASKLQASSSVVAVKMGAEGGLAIDGDIAVREAAIPMEVVDTVGAGDTFDAGFIYGFLQGWPLQKSLKLGIACGSLSTQKSGGLEGQPTLSQALKIIE